jgi:chromosome segregation ATPase
MHAHAAAVSAAECAPLIEEIEALRQDGSRLTAERDALRQYLDAAQRRAESLREQLTLAETVRAGQVAGLVEGAEKLRERVAVLEPALTAALEVMDDLPTWSNAGHACALARAALKGER